MIEPNDERAFRRRKYDNLQTTTHFYHTPFLLPRHPTGNSRDLHAPNPLTVNIANAPLFEIPPLINRQYARVKTVTDTSRDTNKSQMSTAKRFLPELTLYSETTTGRHAPTPPTIPCDRLRKELRRETTANC